MNELTPGIILGLIALFFVLTVWEMVWKGIAMWKSARRNQTGWFVCVFIFNTVGILPIIYLLFFQKKKRH
ncbi:DUF5652 family protein [Thermoproteota archaeon]